MSRARAVLTSTLGNTAVKVASLGLWFAASPFLVRSLGADAFGARFLLATAISWSALVDYALGAAVVREIAAARARGRLDDGRAILATAARLAAVYAALVAAAAVLAAPILAPRLAGPSLPAGAAAALVLLTGAEAIAALAFVITGSALRGLQRFDLANLSTVLAAAASAAAAVVAVALGGDVRAMVAATTATMALLAVANLGLVRRAAPELRLGFRSAGRETRRQDGTRLRRFAAPVFLASLAAHAQTRIGELLVAGLLTVASVTPFHLARRLAEIPAILSEQLLRVLLPLTAALEAAGDRERLRELYLTGMRIVLAVNLATGTLLALFAERLLALWIGPVAVGAAPVVVLLVAAALFESTRALAGTVLQGMGRHRALAPIALVTGAAGVALAFALAPRAGLAGVAVAMLAPAAAATFGGSLPLVASALGVSARELALRAVWPAVAPLAPMLLVVWFLRSSVGDASWSRIALVTGAALLTYGAVYLRFGASELERRLGRTLLGG